MKQKINLKVAEEAKKYLAKKGYDFQYGARPLKRVIQNEILNPLALKMIEGTVKEGEEVKVGVRGNKIILTK